MINDKQVIFSKNNIMI